MKIDYIEMVDYFCAIINDIQKVQEKITDWKQYEEPEPIEELLKKAKNDEFRGIQALIGLFI